MQPTRYKYNGKELNDDFGLNWNDYGARWYDATVGRWWVVDPLAEKYKVWSGYNYGLDNSMKFIAVEGNYAVSVHYKMTFKTFRDAGYSKKDANRYAHYASTYSDNPPVSASFLILCYIQHYLNHIYIRM